MTDIHSDRFLRFTTSTDAIIKRIQKFENTRLSSFGIKSMHLTYLYCLSKSEEGMTPGELSSICRVDKAFISRLTTEMYERGYVELDTSSELSRYRRRIKLTDRGREMMAEVSDILTKAVEEVTEGLAREEFESFYKVIDKLEGNIEKLSSGDTKENT